MYLVLLVVGLLVSAAGFITIGFGIPINAFSLGNTLIIAGTTAVVGGLLLVGLAAAVRSLQRVADALGSFPVPRPAGPRPVDSLESAQGQPAAPALPVGARPQPQPPVPPRPPEAGVMIPPERRPPEPPIPPLAAPASPPPAEVRGPLDWLRPTAKDRSAETATAEKSDEAPLIPRAPSRPILTQTPEPMLEPRPPGRSGTEEPRPAPRAELARPAGDEQPAKDQGLFDVVWPAARPGAAIAPARREPAPAAAAPPSAAPRREEPKRAEPGPAPSGGPAILKSGVIDGMAYTLYADGSIEAELPQGTIKFASIDALRAHLEKHGG